MHAGLSLVSSLPPNNVLHTCAEQINIDFPLHPINFLSPISFSSSITTASLIMTSSNKERYSSYSAVGKSRRSSPGDSHSAHAYFPTGQGGRTVLPPLSDSFPTSRFPGLCSQYNVVDPRSQPVPLMNTVPHTYSTPYTQPRSAPNKLNYDLDTQSLYGAYPTTSTC